MKKRTIILLVLIFFAGLCVLLYPSFSSWLYNQGQTAVVSDYEEALMDLSEDEITTLKAQAQSYNAMLSGDGTMDTDISGISYIDFLNVGDTIGYIEIPKIDVKLPIYHGTSDEVLQKGVGHLETSSLPVGGISTHAVLTGHRGLPTSTLFTHLDKLEEGDIFYIKVLDEVLSYEVDQILVVVPEDTSALEIVQGKDYCTLVTCTPYMINTHRMLVRGERCNSPYETETVEIEQDAIETVEDVIKTPSIIENTNQFIIIYFAGAAIVLCFVYAAYYIVRVINRHYEKKAQKEANKAAMETSRLVSEIKEEKKNIEVVPIIEETESSIKESIDAKGMADKCDLNTIESAVILPVKDAASLNTKRNIDKKKVFAAAIIITAAVATIALFRKRGKKK